jgi:hypothetical protein
MYIYIYEIVDIYIYIYIHIYIYIYIYIGLLVKAEILMSYIYEPTFGKVERRLFLFPAQCFNNESMQKVFLCHSCV